MSAWELIQEKLQQPEYLHVLINPLPVYGVAMGLLAGVVALILKERRAKLVALAILFVGALSAWPAGEYGEQGFDRVLSASDHTGGLWLKEHAHRADQVLWVYYAAAALAAAAVFVPVKWPRSAQPLFLATMAASLIALGCGCYIAQAGGQIRHSEFRDGPAPIPPASDQS